jgi:hypothetical protein
MARETSPLVGNTHPMPTAEEPRMNNLPSRVAYTVMFLRMAETEMRELAERTPEVGRELQHIADALNAEANDLAKLVSE